MKHSVNTSLKQFCNRQVNVQEKPRVRAKVRLPHGPDPIGVSVMLVVS